MDGYGMHNSTKHYKLISIPYIRPIGQHIAIQIGYPICTLHFFTFSLKTNQKYHCRIRYISRCVSFVLCLRAIQTFSHPTTERYSVCELSPSLLRDKLRQQNTSRILARFMQNTLITLFGFSVFFIIIITIIIMVCYVISSYNPDTSKQRNNILNIVLYFMLKVSKELHKEEIPQSFQIYNPQQQFDKTNQEWIKLENFLNNF